MPTVDLVYDVGCPNVALARGNLMRAFSKSGVQARWQEHRIGDPAAPDHIHGYGSPTILVDGRDVAQGAEGAHGAEASCRLYDGAGGFAGAPPVDVIAAALAASDSAAASATPPAGAAAPPARRLSSILAMLPGVGAALLPKLACPLCWPAYAGLLSATGLTFLMEARYLLPLTALLLGLALLALVWRARARRGYGPALVGLVAAGAILAGKFALDSAALLYVGVAALVAASVWNAWPRRAAAPTCSACTPRADHGHSTTLQGENP